jgi:hypothetical protein
MAGRVDRHPAGLPSIMAIGQDGHRSPSALRLQYEPKIDGLHAP